MDIKLNPTYYASIMLDAFSDLLCSELCWDNRPGPKLNYNFIFTHVSIHGNITRLK